MTRASRHRRLGIVLPTAILLTGLPASQAAADPLFDVHEWGVIEFTTSARLGTGPAPAPAPATPTPTPTPTDTNDDTTAPTPIAPDRPPQRPVARKPIVYVTTAETEPFDLALSVRLTEGQMLETWPVVTVPLAGSLARFDVRVHPHACGDGSAPDPAPRDVHCDALPADALCEARELSEYHEASPTCLEHRAEGFPLLLYNGPLEVQAPIEFTRERVDGSTRLLVRNTTDLTLHEVLVRDGRQFWYAGTLGPGAVWSNLDRAPDMHAGVHDDMLVARTVNHLTSLGMAPHAIRDFAGAWLTPPFLHAGWDVWGFYSTEMFDALAPMTVEPAPQRIHRALAFSVSLPD